MTTKITYLGNLQCKTVHIQSNSEIITDAPKDNHGKGSSFSPTDLFASSLGQCILTTLAIIAPEKGIKFENATCEVTKKMKDNPRSVGEISCRIIFDHDYNEKERKLIEAIAHSCPISKSIHPSVVQNITFVYPN